MVTFLIIDVNFQVVVLSLRSHLINQLNPVPQRSFESILYLEFFRKLFIIKNIAAFSISGFVNLVISKCDVNASSRFKVSPSSLIKTCVSGLQPNVLISKSTIAGSF